MQSVHQHFQLCDTLHCWVIIYAYLNNLEVSTKQSYGPNYIDHTLIKLITLPRNCLADRKDILDVKKVIMSSSREKETSLTSPPIRNISPMLVIDSKELLLLKTIIYSRDVTIKVTPLQSLRIPQLIQQGKVMTSLLMLLIVSNHKIASLRYTQTRL